MTYEHIQKECETIEDVLNYSIAELDKSTGELIPAPDRMIIKLSKLQRISSTCARCIEHSIILYSDEVKKVVESFISGDNQDLVKTLPASTLNTLIKAKVGKYEGLKAKAERLDSKVSHAIDATRSQISYFKEFLTLNSK